MIIGYAFFLADINEERITCAFHPEDVVKLVDIEDVDNIYIVYGQEQARRLRKLKSICFSVS